MAADSTESFNAHRKGGLPDGEWVRCKADKSSCPYGDKDDKNNGLHRLFHSVKEMEEQNAWEANERISHLRTPLPIFSNVELELDYDTENWWPSSVGDSADLPVFSGERWRHVLEGNMNGSGGGHLFNVVKNRKIQGKTAFSVYWSENQIGEAVALCLRQCAEYAGLSSALQLTFDGPHEAIVEVEGRRIKISVVLEYDFLRKVRL